MLMDYNTIMTGFTKLFAGIVHSTVWREEMHVKVVWITMLALADRHGRVLASFPGLADAARVSLEQCRDALDRLGGPDEYSRTKDHEGRRVEEIDGGWRVLNYLKYREMRDDSERRIQVREAVRRYREKKSESITVRRSNRSKPEKAQAEAEAEAEEQQQHSDAVASGSLLPGEAVDFKTNSPRPSWSREASDDWIARFGGTAPGGQIGKALKRLVDEHGWPEVRQAWQSYLSQTEAEFASPSRFSATYGRWSGSRPERSARSPGAHDRAVRDGLLMAMDEIKAKRGTDAGREFP
jgi:hypothetical protein